MGDEPGANAPVPNEVASWSELLPVLAAAYDSYEVFDPELVRFSVIAGGNPIGFGVRRLPSPTPGSISFDRAGTATISPTASQWLVLSVKICPVERLRARPALVANLELPIGALAVVRDWAVVQQTLPLCGLRTAQLDHAVRALAALAVELRAAAAGGDHPYAYVFR